MIKLTIIVEDEDAGLIIDTIENIQKKCTSEPVIERKDVFRCCDCKNLWDSVDKNGRCRYCEDNEFIRRYWGEKPLLRERG